MFAAFFYLLRQRGLDVSLNEWMTLLEGMERDCTIRRSPAFITCAGPLW